MGSAKNLNKIMKPFKPKLSGYENNDILRPLYCRNNYIFKLINDIMHEASPHVMNVDCILCTSIDTRIAFIQFTITKLCS